MGAISLADQAEKLESAGKDSDIEYIRDHHNAMMEEYAAIMDELTPALKADDDRPEIPEDVLVDAYAGLSEFVESMDYDLARMVMDSVHEYRLPAEDDDRFDRINSCLMVMDWNGIKRILNER